MTRSRFQRPEPLTVGDGFRLGLGFMLAQVVFTLFLIILWVAGLGALLVAAAAAQGGA